MDKYSMLASRDIARKQEILNKWIVLTPLLLATILIGVIVAGIEAAWLLALASIGLIILVFAEDSGLQLLLLVSAVIRYAVIFMDHYYAGASLIVQDAARFVRNATFLALENESPFFLWRGEQGDIFYDLLVSRLFQILGAQALVIQVMTVFAFLIFLIIAYRIGIALRFSSKNTLWALAIVSLLPSTIFFTISGLREAWLLILLSSFLLAAIKLRDTSKFSLKYFLIIILTSVGLLLMHKAFSLIMPVLLPILLIFLLLPRSDLKHQSGTWILWSLVLLLILSLIIFNERIQTNLFRSILQGELLELFGEGRYKLLSGISASSAYRLPIKASSFSDLLISFPQVYLYYMAAPFPWHIDGFYDIFGLYSMFDAWIGLIFVSLAIAAWFTRPLLRTEIFFLLVVFLIISGSHAFGTLNYGTAIRHRLLSMWIVTIIGLSIFERKSGADRLVTSISTE